MQTVVKFRHQDYGRNEGTGREPLGSTMSEAKKTSGRPPKAPEKGRRRNYAFRMSDDVRDRVVAAAEQAGRSMSEEVERRIEDSFKQEAHQNFTLMLFNRSPNLQNLVLQIATVGGYVESLKDADGKPLGSKDWENHEPTRAGIRAALTALIDVATHPTRDIDTSVVFNRIKEITEGLKTGKTLSDNEALEMDALHADLEVAHMVLRSQMMVGAVSGTIGPDDLKSLGARKK